VKVLLWGSRSLTWKHLPVFRMIAAHARQVIPPSVGEWLKTSGVPQLAAVIPASEPLVLLNGDGPPGKERGAIGADKLAVLACMESWPEEQRRMRWFKPEDVQAKNLGMSWAQAAAMRDVAMAEARPDRAYCVHTDLDASKGSIITARALTERGVPYWYVRVTQAGAFVAVEERR
jgi:hypothetical protein